jgi:hypothetical protein
MKSDLDYLRGRARQGNLFIPKKPKMREETREEECTRIILEQEKEIGRIKRNERRKSWF